MTETVLVTGATGFIGKHCVRQLLEEGYTVRGTIRSEKKEAALRDGLPHGEQLSVVLADLMKDDGWDEAMAGCDYVLHVASPFAMGQDDSFFAAALAGTERVLHAALKAGVKRVVVTSSAVAIGGGHDAGEHQMTEELWTKPDLVDPYARSKTIAERAVWAFAEAHPEIEIVTVNPTLVIGPLLDTHMSTSHEVIRSILAGDYPAVAQLGWCYVDARDVAKAHILAMTSPDAVGERFICTDQWLWLHEVATILNTQYPDRKISTMKLPNIGARLIGVFDPTVRSLVPELGRKRVYSPEKIKRVLGWQSMDVNQSIIDTAESLIEYGIV